MNSKLAILFALTTVGVLLAWRAGSDRAAIDERRSPTYLSPTTVADSGPLSAPPGRDAGERGLRRELASFAAASIGAASDAAGDVPASRIGRPARGRVLDATGSPLMGVPVRVRDAEARAVSKEGGWFELETQWDRGTVTADDEHWCTLYEGVFSRFTDLAATVIVARAARYEGRVVDEAGRPLPESFVHRELPADFDARFGVEVEATQRPSMRVRLDDEGRFEFTGASLEGVVLAAFAAGHAEARVALDPAGAAGLELVLARARPGDAGVIRGRVVTPEGTAARRARVALGLTSVLADDAGCFEIQRRDAVSTERLVAIAAGYLPGALLRPLALDEGVGGWPAFVEVTLGPAPLRIEGRVVDEGGAPVPGVHVWLHDTERFGLLGRAPLEVEALAAGAAIPPEALLSAARLPADDGDDDTTSRTTIGPASAVWNYVVTDGAGAFAIGGLSDRSYALRLLDPRSGAVIDGPSAPAGARGVEVVLPEDVTVEELNGLVVGPDARPLSGVEVVWSVDARSVSSRVFGGRSAVTYTHRGERVSSDADGRFRFTRLPRQALSLSLTSEHIAPEVVPLSRQDVERGRVTVQVEVRCRFRVTVGLGTELGASAVAVTARDADGEPLEVLLIRGESVTAYTNYALVGGSTEVLAVRSSARTIVLLDAAHEALAARSVSFAPDGTNLVEF